MDNEVIVRVNFAKDKLDLRTPVLRIRSGGELQQLCRFGIHHNYSRPG